ncbi:energy taxis-modulating methyl-accepting chemotaxis protein with Cache_1 sensory domain [Desulfoluna limicola]|uniref:Energy taxis-modulating methyl-accepting chemotaxis protein with Cache_1 sensory domain n=1 Tax=Desulfoluna limicola TaxID=2810562 RepID=A0ABM7PE84_9BACT|nr:methyl-accepting chemotaxis protein [Desulfoluna limicola]BCS95485.1 energy taxis-modulating methyl-accepting chemotaxis protein with Cache_1 sensory domain [Desulfoluna limicola]
MTFGNLKIKTKILLGVTTLFVLMMVVSSFVSTRISFSIIYDRITTKEAPASASHIAGQFDKKIHNTISISKLIADNPFFIHWIESGEGEDLKGPAIAYLKEAMNQDMAFAFLVSDKSKNYYTADGFFKTVDANSERDGWYFNALKSGEKVSINIEANEETGDLMAFINVLIGSVNAPYGVAGAGINLNKLSGELKSAGLSEGSVSYLIGGDGGIKAHPDESFISTVKNIKHIKDQGFQEKIAGALLNQDSGVLEYEDAQGINKLVVFTAVESSGWKIVIETPKKELGKGLGKITVATYSMLAVFIVLLVIVLHFLVNIILKPVNDAVVTLEDISEGEGDLTKRLTVVSKDEAGQLASNFNRFVDKLQVMIQSIAGNSRLVKDASGNLAIISQDMADNSTTSSSKSQRVARASDEMNVHINEVAQGMETASSNVGQVAAATEEMSATIHEIAKNSENARRVTLDAVKVTRSASEEIGQLGKAAVDIAKVIETITDISEQTNLLALNATIEAARAGEAGKGFSVVANEIKDLAGQTNHATEDIKSRIHGIQASTTSTVEGIGKLSAIIDSVNEIVESIAAAVEEQSATTSEISRNVAEVSSVLNNVHGNISQVADTSGDIAREIDDVNQNAQELSENSLDVLKSSEELKTLADELTTLVDQFRV